MATKPKPPTDEGSDVRDPEAQNQHTAVSSPKAQTTAFRKKIEELISVIDQAPNHERAYLANQLARTKSALKALHDAL